MTSIHNDPHNFLEFSKLKMCWNCHSRCPRPNEREREVLWWRDSLNSGIQAKGTPEHDSVVMVVCLKTGVLQFTLRSSAKHIPTSQPCNLLIIILIIQSRVFPLLFFSSRTHQADPNISINEKLLTTGRIASTAVQPILWSSPALTVYSLWNLWVRSKNRWLSIDLTQPFDPFRYLFGWVSLLCTCCTAFPFLSIAVSLPS